MSSTTLVSIVLPTYNGAAYLRQAIQSVLDQTHIHWELIIVDSFSTDETPAIIEEFCHRDSRITSIQHPKEAGRLPGALNAGFQRAQGEYHTWLSDDNFYRPQALDVMATVLDQSVSVGLVYSDYTVTYEDSPITELKRAPAFEQLAEKNIVTPSFMYRQTVYHVLGGYRTQFFLAEDYDFWLRAAAIVTFQPVHQDLHGYRFHHGALTATYQTREKDDVAERVLLDNLAHSAWLQRRYRRGLAFLYLAQIAGRQGHTLPRASYVLRAAWNAPFLVFRRLVLWIISLTVGKHTARRISRGYVALKARLRGGG